MGFRLMRDGVGSECSDMRVTTNLAATALDVLEGARDVGDAAVANACRRVRTAWLMGRPAAAADVATVREFAE